MLDIISDIDDNESDCVCACSLSLLFPVGLVACHVPDRLQKGPHVSRVGWSW